MQQNFNWSAKQYFLGTWEIDSTIYTKEQSAKNKYEAPQKDKVCMRQVGEGICNHKVFMEL